MKYLAFLLFALIPAASNGGQVVAVSAGGKISVFQVDGTELKPHQSIDLGQSSGPMGLSPDRKLLYVNTSLPETKTPAFATFAVKPDGTLKHIHTAACGWNNGYLRPDATGRFIAGNNYGAGKVGIWALADDGVYRGDAPRDFELEKKAHSAVFSTDNRFLFVPATGPNKVFQLVFNSETGSIHPNQPSSAPGPQGGNVSMQPRHIIFHPTKDFAYTSNEKELPGVGVWTYNRERGLLENIQAIPSVEIDDAEGMSTADLHFSKDYRFVFVSNRDGKNRKLPNGRDAIAVFKIDDTTGKLTFVKRFSCEKIPRSFAVGLDGKMLFVGGQGDAKLGAYQIDASTGHLTKTATVELPGNPRWVSVIPANGE